MKSLFKNDIIQWSFVIIITIALLLMQNQFSWIKEFPKEYIIPLSSVLNTGMNWVVEYCGWFFKGISWFLEWPIKWVRVILHFLPWTVTVFLFCLVSYIASGWTLVLFTLLSTLYMVCIGYWVESMNSFSLGLYVTEFLAKPEVILSKIIAINAITIPATRLPPN